MKTKHMTKLFAGFSVALAVQTAFAGNITDINVSTLPDNQKIIKIRFDKDVTTPHGFVTSTPARIALDFANTNIRLPQPVLEYADPLLNQITAAQNNDRARVVLGLNKISQYNTEIRGNEVWVFVNESTDQTNAAVVNERAATPSTARATQAYQAVSAANIDFRKGARNSGIIELSAPGFSGQPDIKQQRDRVVVTLKTIRCRHKRNAVWMWLTSIRLYKTLRSNVSAILPSSLSATIMRIGTSIPKPLPAVLYLKYRLKPPIPNPVA